MNSEKQIAVSGGIWTGVSTGVTMLSQILRIVILTRFLAKSDFGIISIVSLVLGLCLAFADLGFSSVIMYKQRLSDKEFSSLFWIQFLIYTFLFFIISIASPLVASFYDEDQLSTLIPIAAVSLMLLSIGKLHESVLQKKYEFRSLAIRNIVSNILSLFLAWFLAWKGFGIYSLILSTLFQNTLYNIWSLLAGIKYYPVRLFLDFKGVLPLLKIGLYQTYTRIADYFSSQLDIMIIGKLLGTEVLGVYDLAKQLIIRLSSFVRSVVSQVALPLITNNNMDDEVVKVRFLTVTKVVSYMCLPISALCAIFSRDIILIMYGEKFIDAYPILAIFSIITALSSVTSFIDMLGIAKGRTDLNFKNTIYRIIINTPIIFLTSYISITFVAIGQLFASIVMFAIFWKVVVQHTYPIPLRMYWSQFSNMFLILALITVICCPLYNIIFPSFIPSLFVRIVVEILIIIGIGLIACRFLKSDINYFLSLFKKN